MRGNSPELTSALRDAFAAHVVDLAGDTVRRANYSLRLSDDRKVFHTLYRGEVVVVASPDPRRLLTALVRHLDAHAGPPPGLLPVQALALVRRGRATLFPMWTDRVRSFDRRLERDDIRLLDTVDVHLDPDAVEVVVQPRLRVDPAALERAGRLAPPPRRPDLPVPDGRYPLKGWHFSAVFHPAGPYSRATAARRAARDVTGGPGRIGAAGVARLAAMFGQVEATGINPQQRDDILAALRAVT